MSSPAPAPLGNRRTVALRAPGGRVFKEQLHAAAATQRVPVILQSPDGNVREFAEATRASLSLLGWTTAWGLGGICANMEDAATFASAGYTWFQFALSNHVDSRAGKMTLDELDAAIVALEDTDCYPPGWHERYLDEGIEFPDRPNFRLTDETLARAAVKFGGVLTLADQLNDSLRTLWSGRTAPPDIEASIATSAAPTTPAELAFLTRELLQRGIGTAQSLRVAPAFGSECEPGCEVNEQPALSPDDCPPGATLSVPAQLAYDTRWERAHHDDGDASILAALRMAATKSPTFFREWIAAACDAFPSSRGGRTYRTTDDDLRFLPQPADLELPQSFLDQWQGCQLLFVTWDEVYRHLGTRLIALLS